MFWEGKLKIILLMLVFLLSSSSVAPQDSETQETDAVPTRPAESDLLLDDQAAAQTLTGDFEEVNFPGVSLGDFLRVIVVLGVIIALIYALVWILKKLTGIKASEGDEIRVYSTRSIKGNSALHLVEAGNRIFLIGSTDSSINLISEIDEKEAIDAIRLNSSGAPVSRSFAGIIKKHFSTKSIRKSKSAERGGAQEYSPDDSILNLQKQRERLKNL